MSETRKYFEHITGKSERVLPTETGWWYAKTPRSDPFVVLVRGAPDSLHYMHDGYPFSLLNPRIEWLEPVAPLGTVASLAAAEAELAALKQRIAAAPVGWSLTADGDDEPWLVSMVHPVCETERRRTGGELRQVRLLEVRDGE